MRKFSYRALLATGLLVSAGALAPQATALPHAPTTAVEAPAVPRSVPAGKLEATGYWTAEKMRTAIPADRPEVLGLPASSRPSEPTAGGVASHPVGPRSKLANDPVPSTAGKVFFSYNGLNYVCSAATINNNNYKNLIMTAGHCVHSGAGQGWHSNIAFAPQYYNGQSGHGLWNWSGARTFTSWISSSDFSHDQAFVTLHPRNGVRIVDQVGGNGLVWGNGRSQPNTRIWGWPAEPPYNGEVPYYCDGTTYAWAPPTPRSPAR